MVLPILGGMLWVYTQRPTHPIKLVLLHMSKSKGESLAWLFRSKFQYDENLSRKIGIVGFWIAFILLSVGCVLSFLLWTGVLKNPRHPWQEKLEKVNIDDHEIVTEGHSIYARRKPTTTSPATLPTPADDGL